MATRTESTCGRIISDIASISLSAARGRARQVRVRPRAAETQSRTMGGENGWMLSSYSRGLTYDLQNLHTIITDVEQANGPRGHASLLALRRFLTAVSLKFSFCECLKNSWHLKKCRLFFRWLFTLKIKDTELCLSINIYNIKLLLLASRYLRTQTNSIPVGGIHRCSKPPCSR